MGSVAGRSDSGGRMESSNRSYAGQLEVIVAKSAGTCFGVESAIEIARRKRAPILGPLVHNPKIVSDLKESGIPVYERYESLERLKVNGVAEVVITAHGYPKHLKEALRRAGIAYYDATCPVLRKGVYRKIESYEAKGYTIILVGNPDHAEVIASRSYGRNIHVVYRQQDVEALAPQSGPCVAICQTTITREKFDELVAYLRRTKCPSLEVLDTRCRPVRNQQHAVETLARRADAMIIIGGFNSANTTNLVKIAQKYLPQRTYQVDSPEHLQGEWLEGLRVLGIGAGTSTPKSQIEAVKRHLVKLSTREVIFRDDESLEPTPPPAF